MSSSSNRGVEKKPSIGIIGGGMAGLTCALLLSRHGYQVTVIEKKQFPFHRVCGEYISNEVIPFFRSQQMDVSQFNPSSITKLTISSTSGKDMEIPLEMGGFGLSRYVLDNYLFLEAKAAGIEFIAAKASNIIFTGEEFSIDLSTGGTLRCQLAIAAYGKRSNLDQKLNRRFFYQRSPYMGVKYHVKTDMPVNLIRLDNFEGGYCGTCKIEGDRYNLCYLSETKNLKETGSIPEMQRSVLFRNPHLKRIFENSDFITEKPEVINEISFEKKSLVEDHILFCGDAAGMITPLCGNGMAIAIHSGKVLAECIIELGGIMNPAQRLMLETKYRRSWDANFSSRLKSGRLIQKLFLNLHLSDFAVSFLQNSPGLSRRIVRSTHGKPF
jgi:menaquinone-9 beta-reductase